MESITSVNDLYLESIRDIYHGEVLLVPELRFFAEKAESVQLQKMIKNHLIETRSHTSRLEEIQENMNSDMLQDHCRTMKSMIIESKSLVDRCTDSKTRERAIVGSLHRITNCLLTTYQMLISMADELELSHHKKILQKHLEDEQHFDKQISAFGFQTLFQEFNLQNKL